ncbi:MAG TPA: hypothetical protein VD978_36355 [Azospirillum sp.]|nr:hypothetical protein [Azospirillum sp.]
MDHNDAPLLARLDRLAEMLENRFDALETRLRDLEKETGELRELLTALKGNLDSAVDELIEAEDDGDGDNDAEEAWYLIH